MNDLISFSNLYLRNLFNVDSPLGGYDHVEYKYSTDLSVAEDDSFIPISNYSHSKIVDGLKLYPKFKSEYSYLSAGIQKDFSSYVTSEGVRNFRHIIYREKEEEKEFYVSYGCILDKECNFLLLVSFRGHLLEENFNGFTRRDVKIFITNEFMTDYRRFYNKAMKEFLQDYIESGCELSIASSSLINDSVYRNKFERDSNFMTVEDKISFIEEFRNTIIEYEQ